MSYIEGPWFPSFHGTICVGVQNTPDGFTQMVCNSILPETDEEYEKESLEIESTMTLIAAAPEMLKALEACKVTLKAFLPEAFATIKTVELAIDKAKGNDKSRKKKA